MTTSEPGVEQRIWRWVALAGALAPVFLFLVAECQRPLPFSTTNDNWSYFLPLLGRVQEAWFSGGPLRVVWDVGQGWSPWESGQIGWLYPVTLLAGAIVRVIGDPVLLLEVNAGVHLVLLALAASWCPPPSYRGSDRAALVAVLAAAPGPLLIGMNWHDYLLPAPWFLVLLGLCWRAVDRAVPWDRREAAGVLGASVLFFLAAHPHMFVLGCAFLALFVLVTAAQHVDAGARRIGVDVVVRLAVAQLPALPALGFLAHAAAQASPVWQAVRQKASVLEGSLGAVEGVAAVIIGPWFSPGHAALFCPLLFALFVLGTLRQRPALVALPILLVVLVVPRLFPSIDWLFVGPLSSFRFPEKLTVYVGPVVAALWFVFGERRGFFRRDVVAGIAAAGSMVVFVVDHDAHTTLGVAHATGPRGLVTHAERCLAEVGVQRGERIAFTRDIPYDRDWHQYPLLLPAIFNHAPLLYGRQSTHVYEPLEPDVIAVAHGRLTAFWRTATVDCRDPATLQMLRATGTDWVVGLTRLDVAPLPATTACGLAFARVPDPEPFPGPGLRADAVGDLWTTEASLSSPPSTPNVARPLEWTRTDDGRWRGRHPLPAWPWGAATLTAVVVALLALGRPAARWPGLRRVPWLVAEPRGPQ
jgi:hypothetical protein